MRWLFPYTETSLSIHSSCSFLSSSPANRIYRRNYVLFSSFFFLIYVGCPGQLTRTTTIPHGPLDILQAQEQVRHRGGDRRTHRGSNPGRGRNKSHELTTTVKPSSAGYTWELEPGHSGRAKPAKATELEAPCVLFSSYLRQPWMHVTL
jgi:hypothetical protein